MDAMKNLLVPCNPDGAMRPSLEAARLVAGLFGGHVEGVAIAPEVPDVLAAEFTVAVPTLDPEARRDLVQAARSGFTRFMAEAGLHAGEAAGEEGAFGWSNDQLVTDLQLGSFGRLFDLIVLGRPSASGDPVRTATVETALFNSGRPILLAPPSVPRSIGGTIVIAWNGSTETARTVALGMPFLQRAERVLVLSVEGWAVEGPSGARLAASLQRNGIEAEAVTRPMNRSPGEAVLDHAHAFGADLVLKGAYTQSRLRQMIFGGATRHIIHQTNLPVLIAH
ncbi:universal stress protein [Antarcticirhabdus aurantiaca]|uniref:Universal stress protein n=1 Tax=Antarcticirhabdus aurantiaca TaxID=2606717 RepID=A0ACD4NK12_9HYPH|nr:universal stress protein [Antarcticirhabdus aurantiaca]WAJ27207.1 universal stress protein [Jeongeuplla avenae]